MTISTYHLTPVLTAFVMLLVPSARAQDAGYDAPAHLKPLEWMVGEWTGEYPLSQGATVMVTRTARWVHNRKFLYFEIESRGGAEKTTARGVYLWDPVARTIRIWFMASNGAWSQGVVEAEEGANRIRITGITAEGKPMSATSTLKRTGADLMTIQHTEVRVDGKPQPDSPESTLRRK